ncbi:deoxyribonuclease-2-beta [Trichonephila clavata]|uniref:Deoxyribonuclease-2-beta n=1 Tax=Trichonephila clavata TaxID=2740835 RepID=A0A8X6KYK1_TRICU|nr:deoxyribonuclease-2-beta [Trichonephila clavata]
MKMKLLSGKSYSEASVGPTVRIPIPEVDKTISFGEMKVVILANINMKMCSFRLLYLIFFVYLLSNIELSVGISCKNEKNEDVDWYIIYKIPLIESEKKGSYLRSGIAYAYLTSDDPDGWKLSSISMQSQKSMLGRTLKGFRDKVDEVCNSVFVQNTNNASIFREH